MTLPASGPISLNNVNVELGLSGTTLISLNQASVRTLAGVPSGVISMSNLYGKSNRVTITITYSSNAANTSVALSSQPGYQTGKTDFVININAGVYLYATSVGNAGLDLFNMNTGDTLTINNSGYILGKGGDGGLSYGSNVGQSGGAGGPAMQLGSNLRSVTVNNNSGAYIAGGGGGGASGFYGGGGGGAGGGAGGAANNGAIAGGSGGGLGGSGSNGANDGVDWYAGGGGGRVLPGTQTTTASALGVGGTAGGAGGGTNGAIPANGRFGGGPTQNGDSAGIFNNAPGGGGGGWGAAGGSNGNLTSGGAAGAAILRPAPSITITLNNSGAIYGAT